jgi:hypothetical protein
MKSDRFFVGTVAGTLLLVLVGCGEDQVVVTDSDPQPTQNDEPQNEHRPDTGDAGGDGAEGFASEVERLTGEAQERARQALEQAGPLLEQAGEVADRIGQSVDEIVQQAAEDLERGVRLLEERIAEMSGERVVIDDTEARLPPEDDLNADTSAAARAVQAGVGPDYVGVWADTADNCGRIDREYVERFAVITPTTIRHTESVCNFEAVPMEGDEATLAAECVAEGDFEERQITLTMIDFETLRISYDAHGGAEFVRCHLPE